MRYVLAVLCIISIPANAQQTRQYDAQGRYIGRTQTNPNGVIRQYDAQGRFIGETRPGSGDRYRSYDAQGRFIGETRGGPPIRP